MRPYVYNITFDCASPDTLATFWAAALGYEKQESEATYAAARDLEGKGPRLYFQLVPEPKQAKNRVHLDLNVRNMEAETERLLSLGARKIGTYEEAGETWTVMHDPEGNEFCIQPEG